MFTRDFLSNSSLSKYYQRVENEKNSRHFFLNEKIICQIVRISEVCDQNGDRVSTNDKICHVCGIRLNRVLAKYEKYTRDVKFGNI